MPGRMWQKWERIILTEEVRNLSSPAVIRGRLLANGGERTEHAIEREVYNMFGVTRWWNRKPKHPLSAEFLREIGRAPWAR